MKILGIDYGTKNIGLALSDDTQKLAFAYKTLNKLNLISELKEICDKEKIEKIIVGLPIGLSGEDTQTTELVKEFINNFKKEINIPVQTVDERLSTVQASRMENKNAQNSIDELSAQVLLQGYLDRH
jgi:putative holliday junction resolvase